MGKTKGESGASDMGANGGKGLLMPADTYGFCMSTPGRLMVGLNGADSTKLLYRRGKGRTKKMPYPPRSTVVRLPERGVKAKPNRGPILLRSLFMPPCGKSGSPGKMAPGG